MLRDAGLDMDSIYLTNVIPYRPPGNDLGAFCVEKRLLPHDYPKHLRPLEERKFLSPLYLPCLDELDRELREIRPNLVILCGGTACWAAGIGSISRTRGVVTQTKWGKAIPVYHPAAVLRAWNLRPTTVMDLVKARYESTFSEIVIPERELWIEPTLEEVREFFTKFLSLSQQQVAFDIETKGGQITCISLAPNPQLSLCVPFFDPTKPNGNYWSSIAEELEVWSLISTVLTSRSTFRIAQNGLYDVQYLVKQGVKVPMIDADTMLLHHALYPESLKGLGFLASIYTNSPSWKGMVKDLGRDK
jgi:hypothetical protein